SLICSAIISLFCERWSRKTMRNVTTLLMVFITSCQVSLNRGDTSKPEVSHVSVSSTAAANAQLLPTQLVVAWASHSMACRKRLSFGLQPMSRPPNQGLLGEGTIGAAIGFRLAH